VHMYDELLNGVRSTDDAGCACCCCCCVWESRGWKSYALSHRVRHAVFEQAFCWGGVDD
jgi:hypothetical protein